MEKLRNIHSIEDERQEVINNDFFIVKYFYFDAGKGFYYQKEEAMASIQVIGGRVTFIYGKEEKKCMMHEGSLLGFDARDSHSVIAHEDSKILLTTVQIK